MSEEEQFRAVCEAYRRVFEIDRRQIMDKLAGLGFPCETWEEAEKIALWLLGADNANNH